MASAASPAGEPDWDLTEAQWRQRLSPEAFDVLRKEGTERPFTSALLEEKREGTFVCKGCRLPLFSSATKYESGTGWPSFWDPLPNSIGTKLDFKLFLPRTEYHCRRCGGHQGHVFNDGPQPTGKRYCNNGVALDFVPGDAAQTPLSGERSPQAWFRPAPPVMVQIRPLLLEDWPATWQIMEPAVRAGETLPFDPALDAAGGYALWVEAAQQAFVAVAADGQVLGTYHIKPNGPTLAAHVCNCCYVVAATARRQGIGSLMFSHSQDQALALGFRAMQFNLVVSTNTAAVQAWQRNGMAIVSTLPGAFRHQRLGFVDAHVMFKVLKSD